MATGREENLSQLRDWKKGGGTVLPKSPPISFFVPAQKEEGIDPRWNEGKEGEER